MIESEVDVVIIGCGPVGAVTANLLGSLGIRTLVLERDGEPHDTPRAVSCDDEAMRVFQRIGLVDEIRREMRLGTDMRFTNGEGETFAHVALSGVDSGFGYPSLFFFHQGTLERILRSGLARYPHLELRLGAEVVALSQDESGVTVTAQDRAGGEEIRVKARYALACDGGRSAARKLAGIELEGTRSEPWLTVTVRLPPGQEPLPSRFVCDPRGPCFIASLPPDYQRFEMMLEAGVDREAAERPEAVNARIAPYLDPTSVTITRAVVYTFQDALAKTWRKGRVLLLGDAAHMMPPFLGQGLCSGFRDASNLTWKLAQVLHGAPPALLDTYESERRPHAAEMAKVSGALGHIFMARNPKLAFARDKLLLLIARIPRVHRFIRDFEFKPLPAVERGFMTGGKRSSRTASEGTMFIQPEVLDATGQRVLLDELLGHGFAVIGMGMDPRVAVPAEARAHWEKVGATFLEVRRPGESSREPTEGLVSVIDADGKLAAWFARANAKLAVVRPDRFVFAVGNAGRGAAMLNEMRAALGVG